MSDKKNNSTKVTKRDKDSFLKYYSTYQQHKFYKYIRLMEMIDCIDFETEDVYYFFNKDFDEMEKARQYLNTIDSRFGLVIGDAIKALIRLREEEIESKCWIWERNKRLLELQEEERENGFKKN